MKKLLAVSILMMTTKTFALDVPMFDDTFINQYKETVAQEAELNQGEVDKLSRLVAFQQRSYEEKINYLEIELNKTKTRLIDKSLNEEKLQTALKDQFENEINFLKKELAAKTRTALEYQRQIEKMNPTEDMKKMIQLNTELASDLRKAEGHLAAIELENKHYKGTLAQKAEPVKSGRKPASIIVEETGK
jgi:hypothetical protein